jgi:hypothetical protein
MDPHQLDADPDWTYHPNADPDPTFHPDADPYPYPDPSFKIKAQTLEKVLKYAHIPHILACHLQIDTNPDSVPDPAYHYYADPDSDFYLMRIRRMRIQDTKMIRIHADPYLQYWLAVHDCVPVRIRV